MAGTDSTGLEPWRDLFRGRDIYDVIGKAVLIAATDSPQEFRRRRDGIVEQIYTAPASIVPTLQGRSAGEVCGGTALQVSDKGSKVASCTVVAPPPPEEPEDKNDEEGRDDQNVIYGYGDNANANASSEPEMDWLQTIADQNVINGYGDNANAPSEPEMDWLQTLADEVDEETQEIDEVLRIKEILLNHHEQSANILFDSLRRLQLMQLTADKIKSTKIGDSVAALSKHKLHKIRTLVREIIKGWKAVVDEWIVATKAREDGDPSKALDTSNPLATEDGVGLAIPPMDVGALFLVSHATAMQNVSEFLQGMDDDGIVTNVGMDKGGGCGSNSKHSGAKPSNTTVPRSKDPIMIQTLPVTQWSPPDKRNPQKLPPRQGTTPSKNTNPPHKLLDAVGNSLLRQQGQQSDLPARQEPVLQKTNIQKTQDQGYKLPQVPRTRIKIKHGYAPRIISEKSLEKKPCEENLGTVTVARKPPIAVAVRDLPSGQFIKMGMPTESSAGPSMGTGKRNAQSAYMNLDETKRKLRGAYQEAENAKKKRAIQVMELCDIPKPNDIEGTQSTTSTNPISRTTPLTKSMNHISRTPSVKQKGHIRRS